MDDEQDPKVEVTAHRAIALFSVPRSVDVSQERIKKYLGRLLERTPCFSALILALSSFQRNRTPRNSYSMSIDRL
jgi:hypothetical protein